MVACPKIAVLGVPLELGAGRPGASQAPAAIRRAGLVGSLKELGLLVEDHGDISVPVTAPSGPRNFKNAAAILDVCRRLEKKAHDIVKSGRMPLILGGDHSLAMGSVSGVAHALRAQKRKIGVIWVDAHADINTPRTTPSGNAHGMPVAHILGMGDARFSSLGGFSPKLAPEHFCLIGIRDVDKAEGVTLRNSGVQIFAMPAIDRRGMAWVMERALAAVSGLDGFYLSFDIDAVDPQSAPGTGTTKRGGLSYREAHLLMEIAAESGGLLGVELTEVNPLKDERNRTSELAVELIASAFGKTIY